MCSRRSGDIERVGAARSVPGGTPTPFAPRRGGDELPRDAVKQGSAGGGARAPSLPLPGPSDRALILHEARSAPEWEIWCKFCGPALRSSGACLVPGPGRGDTATSRLGVQGNPLPASLGPGGHSKMLQGWAATLGWGKPCCGHCGTCLLQTQLLGPQ